MNDDPRAGVPPVTVGVDVDQDVLAAPAHAGDARARRDRAQAAQVDRARGAAPGRSTRPPRSPPAHQRLEPAHDRLDFGQLRHRAPPRPSAPASAKASASRAKSATDSSSARWVPAMPLAASAARRDLFAEAGAERPPQHLAPRRERLLDHLLEQRRIAHRRQRRGPGHEAHHRRGHRRRGMKRARPHVEQDARLGVLRDRHREPAVDAAAGRRDDPLGQLALDHHHRARDGAGAPASTAPAPARWRSDTAGCRRRPAGARAARARRREVELRASAGAELDARLVGELGGQHPQHVGIALDRDDPRAAAARPRPAPPSACRARRRSRPPRRRPPRAPPRRCARAPRDRAGSSAPRTSSAASPCRASTRRGSSLADVKTARAAARDRRPGRGPSVSPARRARPRGGDHRGVVGAALGRRNEEIEAVLARGLGQRGAQPAVGRHAAADDQRAEPLAHQRAPRLAHQHVDDRRLEAGAKVGQRRPLRDAPSSPARVATAVFRPEKLKSRSSRAGSARGSATARGLPVAPAGR